MSATRTKTVVEIEPESHKRVHAGAKKSSRSVKDFTSLMLDYALTKFEAGEISITSPSVEEKPAKKPR